MTYSNASEESFSDASLNRRKKRGKGEGRLGLLEVFDVLGEVLFSFCDIRGKMDMELSCTAVEKFADRFRLYWGGSNKPEHNTFPFGFYQKPLSHKEDKLLSFLKDRSSLKNFVFLASPPMESRRESANPPPPLKTKICNELAGFLGQSPHAFRLNEKYCLLLGGGAYPDRVGGIDCLSLLNASLLNTISLEAKSLPIEVEGGIELSFHGCAIDFCPAWGTFVGYGGGNHGETLGEVFSLQLVFDAHCVFKETMATLALSNPETHFRIHVFKVPTVRRQDEGGCSSGSPSPAPVPRSGHVGCVFKDEFFSFGGRAEGGALLDELWALDLSKSPAEWYQPEVSGKQPAPRVWSCAVRTGADWVVYGGGPWVFVEEEMDTHDAGILHVLNLERQSWSCVRTSGSIPPLVLGGSLCAVGARELWLFGGVKPYVRRQSGEEGTQVLRGLTEYQLFYENTQKPHVLDLRTYEWRKEALDHFNPLQNDLFDSFAPSDADYRSHAASLFLPCPSDPSRSCLLLLGGGRYFNGQYFHDVRCIKPTKRTGAPLRLGWGLDYGTIGRYLPFLMMRGELLRADLQKDVVRCILSRYGSALSPSLRLPLEWRLREDGLAAPITLRLPDFEGMGVLKKLRDVIG